MTDSQRQTDQKIHGWLKKPDIFDYESCAHFLSAYLIYLQTFKQISMAKICKEAGFKNKGYLNWVTEGKRKLSLKWVEPLSRALSLKEYERDYFRLLVLMDGARTEEERSEVSEALGHFREFFRARRIQADEKEFFSNWINSAVLTFLEAYPNAQIEEMATGLSQERDVIEEAIHLLMRLKMIEKTGDLWRRNAIRIESELNFEDGVGQFHRELLNQALRAVDSGTKESRKFIGLHLCLTRAQYQEVAHKLWNFLSELNEQYSIPRSMTPQEERNVFQLGLQLFDLQSLPPSKSDTQD